MKKTKENLLTSTYVVMGLALIACFLWGSAFPSIKTGYKIFNIANDDTYSKILFAGYRFFLSSIMIFLYCFITKYSIKISKKNIYKLILLGILQTFFQYIFFYIGLSNTTGVKGSILSASGTFFAVMIAHFFYTEDKMTWKKILGLILGFTGVIIVNSNKGSFSGGFRFTGEGFILLASLFGAFASVYTKKLVKEMPPFAITAFQLCIGSIALIITGFSGVSQNIAFTPIGSVLLLYMAFISAAAFSIWTTLLKYNGVGRVSIYKFSIPLFGVFLSFIILKESFSSSNVLLAVIFVSLGIYLINKK